MAPTSTRQRPGTTLAVSRWSRSATATTAGSAVALAVLAVLPYLAGTGITQALVTMFLLVAMAPVIREAYTYWAALVLMAVIVAGVYLLVRSRFGLDSRAVHDEPAAAAAMGVEVQRTRWLAYVLAAVGFGAVGGMLIVSTLYIDPATVFNVNYSADMLFMVVIGGLGTMEGPIIGAVIFFAVQEQHAGTSILRQPGRHHTAGSDASG